MRHKDASIMVASQDPPSVPVSLIELSSQIILHTNSPAWLKHIQKANAALTSLTADKMAHLRPGEAYIWSSKATMRCSAAGRSRFAVGYASRSTAVTQRQPWQATIRVEFSDCGTSSDPSTRVRKATKPASDEDPFRRLGCGHEG